MKKPLRLIIAALAFLSAQALAHDYELGVLKIGHPWARAMVPAQKTAAGYLSMQNTGKAADRLVGASTPDAARVEMHITRVENDVAKMREVKAFDIAPGETLKLEPGGAHLMLVSPKRVYQAGERVPLTLRFEKAGELKVELTVEAQRPAKAETHQH
jgi:copper(I)-binding protein